MNRLGFAVLGVAWSLALSAPAGAQAKEREWHGELAYGQWSYDASGTVRDTTEQLSFSDLGRVDEDEGYLRLGVSFPHRWMPDILLERQAVDAGATAESGGFLVIPGSSGVASAEFDITALSVTLPLIEDGVRLGLGVLVENIDGLVRRQEDGELAQSDRYDEIYPLALLRLDVAPFGPITLRVETAYVASGDDRAIHLRGSLLWPVIQPLGLELGLQSRRYRFTTSNYAVDAEFKGGYMGLLLKF
ncbi:hypothetical protein [Abyssibacter sp.]|uniref:hypothetical protein n=1 Tax=Abyssibacter sp. TaxID=2320200 RepID=UPI000C548B36|nr:hypothetical protein [Xanthomonadales bacterium]